MNGVNIADIENFSGCNEEDAIKVYLRLRPSCLDENNGAAHFNIHNDTDLTVESPVDTYAYKSTLRTTSEHYHRFTFTKIFPEDSSQNHVFEASVMSSIKHFMDGFNCLIFTYGVTNSGKTFTLVGDSEKPGLIYNALNTIYSSIDSLKINERPQYFPKFSSSVAETNDAVICELENIKSDLLNIKLNSRQRESLNSVNSTSNRLSTLSERSSRCTIRNLKLMSTVSQKKLSMDYDEGIPTTYYIYLSIAEIYNEKIFDLLNLKMINKLKSGIKKSPLSIGVDLNDCSYIKDLTYVHVKNVDEALKIINAGIMQRKVAMTKLNMQSSRSHVMYRVKLIKAYHLPNDVVTTCNEMCFVDLAGSERPSKTLSEGIRFKEASNINLSLLVLSKCIETLKQNRGNHSDLVVPFRESKLTKLLQPFFISNASINLFANISSDLACFDETLSVLKFSAITKEALTRPLTMSLMEISNINHLYTDTDMAHISSSQNSELVNKLRIFKKQIDFLENERHCIESKIRKDCFDENHKIICSLEDKHKKNLFELRKSITDFYKNKLARLNEYYQDIINENDKQSNLEESNEIALLKQELIRKIEDAENIKTEYQAYFEQMKDSEIESFHTAKYEILQKEIDFYKNHCEKLQEENTIHQNELYSNSTKIKNMRAEYTSLECDYKIIKDQLLRKTVEIEQMTEESANFHTEISVLTNILEEKTVKIDELESDNAEKTKLYIEASKNLETMTDKYTASEKSCKKYMRKIERDEDRLKVLRVSIVEKDDLIRKYVVDMGKLADELKLLKSNKISAASSSRNSYKHDDLVPRRKSRRLHAKEGPSTVCSFKDSKAFQPSTPVKNIAASPCNHAYTTTNNADQSSPSGLAFRRLYEETRVYAMKMEERVKDLQTELSKQNSNLSSKKENSTFDIGASVNIISVNGDTQHNGNVGLSTPVKTPTRTPIRTPTNTPLSSKSVVKYRSSTKRKHNDMSNTTEVETNPSVVFSIRSVSPVSRKREKQNYNKRIKGYDVNNNEHEISNVDSIKKKLNLV